MKRTILISALLTCAWLLSFGKTPEVPTSGRVYLDMNMERATAYCDTAAIRGIEGIYLWADRDAVVLLRATRKMHSAATEYEIVNIESSDIMYAPGAVMGYLYPTGATDAFHAYLFDNIEPDKAVKPKHKSAKYTSSDHSIKFDGKQTKLSFNPLAIIPRVRSIMRIKQTDPLADLPDGLLLIYPVTNASLPFPRYL